MGSVRPLVIATVQETFIQKHFLHKEKHLLERKNLSSLLQKLKSFSHSDSFADPQAQPGLFSN
jgi:hypothetical protein